LRLSRRFYSRAHRGLDSDGVTGPEAGRACDAAALPAADRLDEIPGLGREAAAALIAEIGLE
jgi:transposase